MFYIFYSNGKFCTHRRWWRRRNFRPTRQRLCSLKIRYGLYGLLSWKRNLGIASKNKNYSAGKSIPTFYSREMLRNHFFTNIYTILGVIFVLSGKPRNFPRYYNIFSLKFSSFNTYIGSHISHTCSWITQKYISGLKNMLTTLWEYGCTYYI